MSHSRRITLGVLVPYTGGRFYTSIIAGAERAARPRGAAVVAFQTVAMDLSKCASLPGGVLGLDVIDGYIVAADANVETYAEKVADAGKPLVRLSAARDLIATSAVLPDNASGASDAVRHLLEHGHRRIGFAGNFDQLDIRERYQAYRSVLSDAGITPDPSLVFETRGNLELDGREAGAQILAAGIPCTALFAATDKNALGILEVLTRAGCRVPEQLALVGFDDIELAVHAKPPLATVRQRYDLLGETAAAILLDALQNGVRPPASVPLPTTFQPRRSCGCTPLSAVSVAPASDRSKGLADGLFALSRSNPHVSRSLSASWSGAQQVAEFVTALGEGRPLSSQSLSGVWDGFVAPGQSVETLESAMALLDVTARAYLAERADCIARAPSLERGLRELRLELLRAFHARELERSRYHEVLAEGKRRITHTLMGTDFAAARSLAWLDCTRVEHACLALKRRTPDGRSDLEIAGTFARKPGAGDSSEPLAACYALSNFPPAALADAALSAAPGSVVTVTPITASDGCPGIFAIVAPVETEGIDHLGSLGEWATMLSAALEREQLVHVLKESALKDALTGLPNRALLMDRLDRAIAVARRKPDYRFAVLFIDIDHFKKVNDSLGHLAGDALLVEVSQRLRRALRDTDTVARLGGDEFAILVDGAAAESDVAIVVRRIQDALRTPLTLCETPVFVSLSIGVTLSSSRYGSAEDLLRDSDSAMYRAKRQGRARYEVSDTTMQRTALERLKLEARVRHALEADQFALHYQPIVALGSGRVAGVEALLRWTDGERGDQPPASFLPITEELALGVPLSEWVILRACDDARRLQKTSQGRLVVSVNLSSQHLTSPDLVPFVRHTLRAVELDPTLLAVELLETHLIDAGDRAHEALETLATLGVGISIDDFGTGYASFSYLKRFRAKTLKIDRTFTSGIGHAREDNAICSALIELAHGLGMTVVAEGVETPEQLAFFRERGCDYGQGFLFSAALPLARCIDYLEETARRGRAS